MHLALGRGELISLKLRVGDYAAWPPSTMMLAPVIREARGNIRDPARPRVPTAMGRR